jgi:branched-chain amino acid transport system permease protein
VRSVSLSTAAAAATGAVLLAFAALSSDRYYTALLTWIALNSLLAIALRFVLLVGEKNVATVAFYGVGAYASAIATVDLGLPFPIALLAAGAVAGMTSLVFGLFTLRVKGPYFMLASFAFTELLRLVYTQIPAIGGNSGIVGIFPPTWLDPWMPALTLIVVGALIYVFHAVEQSDLGRTFRAIGLNDAVVASVGIDIFHMKLLCLVAAAVAVGIGGALLAHTNNVISPPDFGYAAVVFALAYIKIGGQSHILGSLLGATILTLIAQALQGSGWLEQVVFGGAIVAGMLLLPDGLLGLFKQALSFSHAWRRRNADSIRSIGAAASLRGDRRGDG